MSVFPHRLRRLVRQLYTPAKGSKGFISIATSGSDHDSRGIRDCSDQREEVPSINYEKWRSVFDLFFGSARNVYYAIIIFLVRKETLSSLNTSPLPDDHTAPYKIMQFWDKTDIPNDVLEFMSRWQTRYKDRYVRFDDQSAQLFILNHFGGNIMDAYRRCWHPAMKSDYFRLCYLLVEGGCYIDADETPLSALPSLNLAEGPLLALRAFARVPHQEGGHQDISISDLVSAGDVPFGTEAYFNNAPIFASAGNPIIALALARATDIILSGRSGTMSLHDITGPTNLSLSVLVHFMQSGVDHSTLSKVISLDWLTFAHVGSQSELDYKNDQRDWRTAERV